MVHPAGRRSWQPAQRPNEKTKRDRSHRALDLDLRRGGHGHGDGRADAARSDPQWFPSGGRGQVPQHASLALDRRASHHLASTGKPNRVGSHARGRCERAAVPRRWVRRSGALRADTAFGWRHGCVDLQLVGRFWPLLEGRSGISPASRIPLPSNSRRAPLFL